MASSDRPAPQRSKVNGPMAFVVLGLALVVGLLAFSVAGKIPSKAVVITTTTSTLVTTTSIPSEQRSLIKVQVANGTTTMGAGGTAAQTLQVKGWNALPPVNTTTPIRTSAVYFAQGKKEAALEIASDLKIPKGKVAAFTNSVPVPGANGDDVVVIIGPDFPR